MGECTREKVVALANALNRVCFHHRSVLPAVTAEKSNRNFAV
jgi:hypothetical protein